MNLHCIAEHTVDISRLKKEGICIDAGCIGFEFSKAMRDLGMRVIAIDIQNLLEVPEGVQFLNYALWSRDNELLYYKDTKDKQAKHIADTGTPICSHDINWFLKVLCNGKRVDVIKMDIEGSEIPVLLSLKEPPADQLSIEFHLHTGTIESEVQEVFKHLESLGYTKIFQDYSAKHGCGLNYWDVLFILK